MHSGYGMSSPPGYCSRGALQVLAFSLPFCTQATRMKSPLVKLADDTWVGGKTWAREQGRLLRTRWVVTELGTNGDPRWP